MSSFPGRFVGGKIDPEWYSVPDSWEPYCLQDEVFEGTRYATFSEIQSAVSGDLFPYFETESEGKGLTGHYGARPKIEERIFFGKLDWSRKIL